MDEEYDLREGINSYYLIDGNSEYTYQLKHGSTNKIDQYTRPSPSPMDNLLSLYGLEPIAKSLARNNPDGSKGVKLRKSYKNHIQDLPGKHQISGQKPIPPGLLDPMSVQSPDMIKEIDTELLNNALRFEKTSINGIPGFNIADLAINDQQMLMRGDDGVDGDDYKKNKRKKKQLNGEVKRQHT